MKDILLKDFFNTHACLRRLSLRGARDSFALCSSGAFGFVRFELSLNFPLSLFVVSR